MLISEILRQTVKLIVHILRLATPGTTDGDLNKVKWIRRLRFVHNAVEANLQVLYFQIHCHNRVKEYV